MAQRAMLRGAAAALTMFVALALLVLALLRWREIEGAASVWLAAMAAQILIRAPYAAQNRKNAIVAGKRDAGEQSLLFLMFVTMMALPLIHLATGVFAFADYVLPPWAAYIGAATQVPFLWLFWRSHADLGRNWSPGLEVRQGHELVIRGVYARIRHPMYVAIWISALAQPLLVQNWIAGPLVIPAFAAMWFLRVPREEAMMREMFGDAYNAYCRKAGRLLPRFGAWASRQSAPCLIEVRAATIHNHYNNRQSAWFSNSNLVFRVLNGTRLLSDARSWRRVRTGVHRFGPIVRRGARAALGWRREGAGPRLWLGARAVIELLKGARAWSPERMTRLTKHEPYARPERDAGKGADQTRAERQCDIGRSKHGDAPEEERTGRHTV
jgi:protein-S-isoprenylcysteine O-methyltransferase Ste14